MAGPRIPIRVRHLTGDPNQDRIDTERDELAGQLRRCPFLVGRLVSVTFPGSVDVVVNHRLGTPASWMEVRGNYDATGGSSTAAEATSQAGLDPNHQIRMYAGDPCTVDLWFYPRASRPIDQATGQSR